MNQPMKYIPYVNIKMGTDSSMRYSRGNTLPLISLPFGMASFSLQSEIIKERERWFFNPDAPYTEGVRLTHQPSPWIGDYGTFLMMPQNDIISNTASGAYSGYRIEKSIFRPDYLKIRLLRSECTLELTPSERGCIIRLSYENDLVPYLSFLPVMGNYTYSLDKENGILFGTNDHHSQDDAKNFKMHFVVKFDKNDIDFDKTYQGENGKNAYIHIAFKTKNVEARVGISYISKELALLSLNRECENKCFDELKGEAESIWEERLHRIEIDSDNSEQLKTFYSCLYRTFLFPHKAYEINASGKAVHYSPFLGKVCDGVRYTDTGFWDTSRTLFPLFSLIAKDEFSSMLEGFVNDYLECGWLPRWPSIGEVGCMPSTLIDSVIAEAAVNGIGSPGILDKALKGMLHHANNASSDKRYGRNGVLEYLKYGYVPRDLYKESVNLSLDAAYGDYCISVVADRLGYNDMKEEYLNRAQNYRLLFDKESGFMRGRDTNGNFSNDFDPTIWGGDYTEGSAWQNSFFVPHDIDGLVSLHGGKDNLIKKLDELCTLPPRYRVHGYNGEIHEMTEMACVDFGQCAISNQPSFHIPYLYALLGEDKKCADIVKSMCSVLFTPDYYPGDEDNGSMSAWYILSTLGIYPVCPGSKELVKIPMLVKGAKILGKDINELML